MSLCAIAILGTFVASGQARQGSRQLSGFAVVPGFGSGSVWTRSVNAGTQPLDPSSAALVSTLVGSVNQEISGRYGPWINTTSYSVPVYDVSANQPRVPVVLDTFGSSSATLRASFAAGVPIPAGAQPAAGSDKQLVVYQTSTNTMWEFWHLHQVSGVWHADWGGTMPSVSQNPGYFGGAYRLWGATATALPLIGGLITPAELQAGVIKHALAIAVPNTRAKVWAFPAQRTDGSNSAANSIPEGAQFRLDPSLNLASLNLPPVTLMLARAAQTYGIIVRDKSAVVTFYAQDPTPAGANPYPQLFGTPWPYNLLSSFPWSHLQLLRMTLS